MSKILIMAEAGVNHNGSIAIAKRLADIAKKAGADIVKYQTFVPEAIVSKFAQKAEYQQTNDPNSESQLEMLRKLALTNEEFVELRDYCEEIGIKFLSTPFDLPSIDFLDSIGIDMWKIPSGEITNMPYLIKIAKTGKPVILSTGMSNIEDVENAVSLLKNYGCNDISILHCTTQYPTPVEYVNLKAMDTLRKKFNCKVGLSDHSMGIEVSIAAAALGAEIIEKHFTLDKNMPGPDHIASADFEELSALIQSVRNVELALGNGIKDIAECEKGNISVSRKSIVASKCIKKGELLSEDNLTVKRPGSGISPMRWNEVIGKIAIRDFDEDEVIEL